jgi:drug/metabolite transporter (DMT)-like permease
VIGSVAMLGIVGLGFAYILYFALIMGAGASRALLVTYLVPPMALFYGATILDESFGLTDFAGLALILAGVSLGTGVAQNRFRRRAPAQVRA